MVADELLRRHGWGPLRRRFGGLAAEARLNGADVLLLLPQTYMNRSGESVGQAVRYFHLTSEDVCVVHDDVELPFGVVRLKKGGGLGGHNGLRSAESALRSREFWRVRVGVGRPSDPGWDLADYVLSPFSESPEEVAAVVAAAADLVEQWIRGEAVV